MRIEEDYFTGGGKVIFNENLPDIPKNMQSDIQGCLKDLQKKEPVSRRRHRKVVESKFMGEDVFVKSYSPHNADNIGDRLKCSSLSVSTAAREFDILLSLSDAGLPVVEPAAAIERSINFFLQESVIISFKEEGVEARKIISSPEIDLRQKRRIMEQAWHYLQKMHCAGIVDSDYKFRNFIYRKNSENNFDLILLDKERARYSKSGLKKVKVWGKFIANWVNLLKESGQLDADAAAREIKVYRVRAVKEQSMNFAEEMYLRYNIKRKLEPSLEI